MNIAIEYNNGKMLSVDMIRRLDRMTPDEQAQMSKNLGVDGSQFNTRIFLVNGREKKARDSIEDVTRQVPLVDVGADRWVVAQNIIETAPFTADQAKKAKERGSTFHHEFQSAVDTIAGRVLSTETQQVILQRWTAASRGSAPRVA